MSATSIALGIALRRLSATAENWELSRPDALSDIFESLKVGTEADTAVSVLAIAYLQSALQMTHNDLFMFEKWPLFVLAAWSLSLKHVYDAATWAIDTVCVWNEMNHCPFLIDVASLRAAEGSIVRHSHFSVASAMRNYRSALARVLVQEKSEMQKVGPYSKSGTVLIVDDDAFVRFAHREVILAAAPLFRVFAVSSLDAAMKKIEEGLLPDVALIDIMLLKATDPTCKQNINNAGDGLDLVKQIRDAENDRLTKAFYGECYDEDEGKSLIVAVSGLDFSESSIESLCNNRGLDAVMKKPLTVEGARGMCGLVW